MSEWTTYPDEEAPWKRPPLEDPFAGVPLDNTGHPNTRSTCFTGVETKWVDPLPETSEDRKEAEAAKVYRLASLEQDNTSVESGGRVRLLVAAGALAIFTAYANRRRRDSP